MQVKPHSKCYDGERSQGRLGRGVAGRDTHTSVSCLADRLLARQENEILREGLKQQRETEEAKRLGHKLQLLEADAFHCLLEVHKPLFIL